MTSTDGDPQQDPRRDWQFRLASFLSSAVGGGLAINALSTDVDYRGPAMAFAVAATLFAAWGVRRYPTSRLETVAVRTGIGAAVAAFVLAVAGPSSWRTYAVLAAIILTLGTSLIPRTLIKARSILAGVAAIGAGLVAISMGVAAVSDQDLLFGVATIGARMSLIVAGVAAVLDQDQVASLTMLPQLPTATKDRRCFCCATRNTWHCAGYLAWPFLIT